MSIKARIIFLGFGIAFIIDGCSGRAVLKGTDSSFLLVVVGTVFVLISLFAGHSRKDETREQKTYPEPKLDKEYIAYLRAVERFEEINKINEEINNERGRDLGYQQISENDKCSLLLSLLHKSEKNSETKSYLSTYPITIDELEGYIVYILKNNDVQNLGFKNYLLSLDAISKLLNYAQERFGVTKEELIKKLNIPFVT